ncbi:SsgA family sporulation/cell division regulator [Streptomyces sp. NPDC059582]|uniref:SsgA family sporulation/cell division regulator n=1 Tax=Streptomyces sp. NPDC059582 TaxID=3346875 RepID=UPI0036CFEA01
MKSLRTVIRGLPVQLVISHEMSLCTSMSLQYEPSDPYAVRASFATGSDETVQWIIGRDLLADGLEGPAGEGDVRVWPAEEHGASDLYILLNPPDGAALFKAPAREIRLFLQDAEAVVPRGAESGHIDLDAWLTHLIATGEGSW